MGYTSIVLINFSVSASSSHLHSSSLSGLVATTLRGPMGASETSLKGGNQRRFMTEQLEMEEIAFYPDAMANR